MSSIDTLSNIFANSSRSDESDKKRKAYERYLARKESLTRLVRNEDFRAWIKYIELELCGATFGRNELDQFTQGKRATASFILETLSIADGGAELAGEITRNHFNAIARAMAENHTKE